jgi:ribosome-associated protein
MHQLQALGERLVQLKEPYLLGLGLSDSLLDAIAEAKRIKGHGAIRRQNQLIGKLMRDIDIEPIEKFFAARQFSK